ncbi:ArnT family glycosyltransferase [Luteibacter sp. CQ10]|uniref:ArnT family glycosyltransferase n=1 Tax=Luteibacter sp. CQ10 TaxID=2805821 RepID=UPI0034A2C05A
MFADYPVGLPQRAASTDRWAGFVAVRSGGLVALLGIRLSWLSAYPLNSDEPQHAHVAWSIAQGAIPYRDVFDNHGPLFSTMYSVLLSALGERPDILWCLRLAVVPWYALVLVATWFIARRLHSRGVADATTLLVGLFPIVFIKSGEFRTDDVWAALWLSGTSIAVLARERPWRWLSSGLMFGAALSVSQKTLPLAAIAIAVATAIWAVPWRANGRVASTNALALLAGVVVVPGAFVLWLVSHHDTAPAWYDIVAYNLAPTGVSGHPWHLVGYLLVALGALACTAWRARQANATARWRAFLGVHALLFMLMIWIAWPLPTEQDFLPVIPMAVLSLVGLVDRATVVPAKGRVALVSVVALAEGALVIRHAPPWHDALAGFQSQMRVVLACTTPADTLMDAKSGSIFRRRPYYPVIESLARQRFQSGRLPDDIAAALVANHTMTALDDRYPPAAQAFIERHYRPGTAGVRMAGLSLVPSAGRQRFDLDLAGDYVVTDGRREVPVSIDGQRPGTSWSLGVGPHTLDAMTDPPRMLLWRQAWECGWRPDIVR